jgi:hypothetical protein
VGVFSLGSQVIVVVVVVALFSANRVVEGSSDVNVVEASICPRLYALSSDFNQIFCPLLTVLASRTRFENQNVIAYLNFPASSKD